MVLLSLRTLIKMMLSRLFEHFNVYFIIYYPMY